jgi:NAD+ kinase
MAPPLLDVAIAPCVVVAKIPVVARSGAAAEVAASGRQVARNLLPAAAEHERTLAAVLAALRDRGVEPLVTSVVVEPAARAAIRAARLVVSVGGDGTLLSASHHVTEAALLGVNSAPADSIGYLTGTRRDDFAATLDAIIGGRQPLLVARIATRLEGRLLAEPALNDVLIAHEHPAATSRYLLRLGAAAEEQRSSGLWVATAAGSTAGIRSSGGRVMPVRSSRLQFRARELLRQRPGSGAAVFALARGFVPADAALVVESQMDAGWLFVDGSRTSYPFPFGARAELAVAPEPLRLFADPRRWTIR